MNKAILIGLCIICLVLLVGAGKKFYLYQYEEECLEYYIEPSYATEYYCDSNFHNAVLCYFCHDRFTKEVKFEDKCNSLDVSCTCPSYYIKNRTVVLSRMTDKCTKYYLVRKVV